MQSDPWWSFAMAVNVYMVFFYSANPSTFRHYLWIYAAVCFGCPMIPAIVCLVVWEPSKGAIYGEATVRYSLSPSARCDKIAVLIVSSCGAGLAITGARSASTPTIYQYGSAHCSRPLSTSPWAITFFTSAISCGTYRSQTRPPTRTSQQLMSETRARR
jgi:hypothetical protein